MIGSSSRGSLWEHQRKAAGGGRRAAPASLRQQEGSRRPGLWKPAPDRGLKDRSEPRSEPRSAVHRSYSRKIQVRPMNSGMRIARLYPM